jgi:hypothetical protein
MSGRERSSHAGKTERIMRKRPIPGDLQTFVSPYAGHIQELCFVLRDFVLNAVPGANELIYDSYNAVSLAFSKSDKLGDAFCHIALYKNHVNFGFNRGTEITDQEGLLSGTGSLVRHISLKRQEDFPAEAMAAMLQEAVANSVKRNPALAHPEIEGQSFTMPTSGKKKRPI